MLDAVTEFRKNSFDDEDSATLGLLATQFQNVADEAISAGDAASFIISQMTAFNITAEDAAKITDSVNEVANQFSVSSADLSNSIGNASSALAVGNNTFEQTLALLTAGTEITRNANKVSRGNKSLNVQ